MSGHMPFRIVLIAAFQLALLPVFAAYAQDAAPLSPTAALIDRSLYYPGTEALAPDEMRITACGTGQPTPRPKQAAACFLVELGNGDKFLFDLGALSMANISGYKIHYDFLDKVFISHLHLDHYADLATLWVGGLKSNRTVPLRVWGPSGYLPELGTAASIEGLKQAYLWEITSASGKLDGRGQQLLVTEFDFSKVNAVIYEENGVVIRAFPAIHDIDGAVSYILEWNGLSFAYSGDTSPNKWWIDLTEGVDVSVHESFAPPRTLIEKQRYGPEFALWLSTLAHTSPPQFAEIMKLTQPRLAVGYHFYNDFDTLPEQLSLIREIYDGPLVMALDNMVINVNKDDFRIRRAVLDEEAWPMQPNRPVEPGAKPETQVMSEFTLSGEFFMEEVLRKMWDDINAEYGSDAQLPQR
ncbi:MAG: guanitoxin biosynthesis MBL fold metallo-hydrolase GntH [Pseudomonadota bacterium]